MKKLEELYKKLRSEFIKERVVDLGKIKADHFYSRIDILAEQVYGKLAKLNKDKYERTIRDKIDFPFKPREYNFVKNVRIVEISWESGVSAAHVLKKYFNKTTRLYIASPFIYPEDIKYLYDFINNNKNISKLDFRIITNCNRKWFENEKWFELVDLAFTYSIKIRFLDIHAKLMVTDQACVLGSMNFNWYGFRRSVSHELILIIEDRTFVQDMVKHFLWWWDLAGDIEKALHEKFLAQKNANDSNGVDNGSNLQNGNFLQK